MDSSQEFDPQNKPPAEKAEREDVEQERERFGAHIFISAIKQWEETISKGIQDILEQKRKEIEQMKFQLRRTSSALMLGIVLLHGPNDPTFKSNNAPEPSRVRQYFPQVLRENQETQKDDSPISDSIKVISDEIKKENKTTAEVYPKQNMEMPLEEELKRVRELKTLTNEEKKQIIRYNNESERKRWGEQAIGTKRTVDEFVGNAYLQMYGLNGEVTMKDLYEIEDKYGVDAAHLLELAYAETQMGRDVNLGGPEYKHNILNVKLTLKEQAETGRTWATPSSYKEAFELSASKFQMYKNDQEHPIGSYDLALRTKYSDDASESFLNRRLKRHDRVVTGLRYLSQLHTDKLITDEQARAGVALLDDRSFSVDAICNKIGAPIIADMRYTPGYEHFKR